MDEAALALGERCVAEVVRIPCAAAAFCFAPAVGRNVFQHDGRFAAIVSTGEIPPRSVAMSRRERWA